MASAPTTTPAFPAIGKPDEWGNIILSSRGWEGQYRIKRWADGREAFVCGQWLTTEHLPWWKFDPRQGYVCRKCWPKVKR